MSSLGRVRNSHTGHVLKPGMNKTTGHLHVSLTHEGVGKTLKVHRLVAHAFIPNPDNMPFVLHWDDGPSNNVVGNLRWGTPSDNLRDRVRNGIHHNAVKTACPKGHEYTQDNILRSGSNGRGCKKCHQIRNRESWRRRNWS